MKQLLLYLAATAAFIVVVGLLTTKGGGQINLPIASPVPNKVVKLRDVEVKVRVADNPETRKKGLSGTKSLGENEGLLFVFDENNTKPVFWMKDMVIPIDIIWIAKNKVVQIDRDVSPPEPGTPDTDLKLYPASEPVDYVLEVNAGFCEKNNIGIGTFFDYTQ